MPFKCGYIRVALEVARSVREHLVLTLKSGEGSTHELDPHTVHVAAASKRLQISSAYNFIATSSNAILCYSFRSNFASVSISFTSSALQKIIRLNSTATCSPTINQSNFNRCSIFISNLSFLLCD